jgi:hypothetical protein
MGFAEARAFFGALQEMARVAGRGERQAPADNSPLPEEEEKTKEENIMVPSDTKSAPGTGL